MRGIKRLTSAIALFTVLLGAQTSLATGSYKSSPKVTICHATSSANNPYVRITVSVSAVDGIAGNSGNMADHYGEHAGPVFEPTVHNQQNRGWGDIIPPVKGVHQGLNWSSDGIAIWKNGCKSPVKPAQPPDKVVYTDWVDGSKSCETKTVTQTRTKSVTSYVWNGYSWTEGSTTVTTETSSRPMTEAELKECSPQPPDKVVYTDWVDGSKSCETKTVTQTRTKSVTSYVWNGYSWTEGSTTVTTETSSRPMTEAELKECSPVVPPPVCVSPNVKATMTVFGVKRVGYLKFFTQRITLKNTGKYTQRHTITLAPQSPRLTFGNGSTKPKTIKFTLKPGAKKTFTVGLRPTKAAFRKWVFFKVTDRVKPIAPQGVKFCSVKELKLGVTRRIWEP